MRWHAAILVASLSIALGLPAFAVETRAVRAQPVPLEIFLTQFTYDEASGTYQVRVSITDPSRVGDLDPRLLDLQSGENVGFGPTIPVTGQDVEFSLPTDQLQSGRKYKLAIRAFQNGSTTQYLRRPSENASVDPLIFASQEFAYNPPQLGPIVFALDGVSADFPRHLLLIAMHHSDTTRVLRYEIVVANKKGGAVGRVERTSLTVNNGIVEAPIPAAMELVDQPVEYQLTFRLFTPDNKLVGEQRKDFALGAPPVPTLVERVSTALNTSPWLGWSLGAVAACLMVTLLFRTFMPRKRKPLPRPQNLEPVFIRPSTPPLSLALSSAGLVSPQALAAQPNPATLWPAPEDAPPGPRPSAAPAPGPVIALLEVTSGAGAGRQYTLVDGEMSIGRADDNDIVIVDSYASRKHARVAKLGDRYVWSDGNAVTEPTHINGNLVSAAHALSDGDSIEVGRTTLVFRRIQQKGPSAAETQRTAMAPVTPAPGRPLFLVIGGVQHTVAPGMTIASQEFGAAGAGQDHAAIAEVMPNAEDASLLGLRNLSGAPWTVTQPNGETVVIEDGRAVTLDDGVKIDFGGAEGSVQR